MALAVKSDGAGGSPQYRKHVADFGTAAVTLTSEKGVVDVWFNGVHYEIGFGTAATVPIPVQQILTASPIT